MRISERIDAAKEACRVLDYEKATVADLDDIKARYRLSEPQFKEAAMAAIAERMKAAELKQVELDAQRLDLINAAKAKGKRQAEIEILNSPLPWSREKMIAMVDLVVDWWLSEASYDENNEFSMDLACEITNGVRVGFIERFIELSATSFPEVRA